MLVARLYDQGWGAGDLAAVDQVFSPTDVLHWNEGKKRIPGSRGHHRHHDRRSDMVAVQVTFVGTHKGVYEGFQLTNRKSRFTDMQLLRFEKGRIKESFLGSGGLKYFFSILDGSAFES